MPVPCQVSPGPKAHKEIIERHWTGSKRPWLMFHLISLPVSPRTSPGPGRGSRGAGGGIGSDPMKLQLRVGGWGIRAGNKSFS